MADCRIFDVVSKRFRHPSRETEGDFYVIRTQDWVNVIPITSNFEMVLVNQYRFGVLKNSWEIPGGVMESGEDPVVAGLRELQEETGFTSERARLQALLGRIPLFRTMPAISYWPRKPRKRLICDGTSMKRSQRKLYQSNAFLIWFSLARSFTPGVECSPSFLPGVGKNRARRRSR